jgi:hypothetical protein
LRRAAHLMLWLTTLVVGAAAHFVCSLTLPRRTYQCNTDSFAFFWALLVLLSVQAVIQVVVAFMDWRMGGQIGGESASLVPVSLCIVAILVVFMATSLVNASSLDPGSEQQASPEEAMISSLIIMLLTALSLVLIVFSKARYVSLSRTDALRLFVGHSGMRSARTEGSAATLKAAGHDSSKDFAADSKRANSDPPTVSGTDLLVSELETATTAAKAVPPPAIATTVAQV